MASLFVTDTNMLAPRTLYYPLLVSLLLALLTGSPALAEQIEGVTVDVGDFKVGFDGDRLVDGDTGTAWIGGGRSTGPGKWIELSFPAPVKLKYLSIANGNQAKGQFNKYRRITRGFIKYPDESRQQFTLKPTSGVQKIELKPVQAESIKIVILGVAPSSKDKSIGKAKVSVSELTVFGKMDELALIQDPIEKKSVEVVEEPTATEEAAQTPAPQEKTEPQKKSSASTDAKPKPASKPTPAPKVEETKPVVKKQAAKPKSAPAKPKQDKPKQPKKTAPQAAPKKVVKKAKPKAKPSASASAPGIAYLGAAVEVPESKPFDIGKISPWINLELVAQIKRYLALLTTLHDSYPDVFVSSLRDKERSAFIAFQDKMRAKKKFGQHHMAQLDHIGLNFDKPVIGDEAATVHVHGPYRYYIGDKTYEFHVDAIFSLMVEGNKWMISSVQAK